MTSMAPGGRILEPGSTAVRLPTYVLPKKLLIARSCTGCGPPCSSVYALFIMQTVHSKPF
jgi:hypothetical protein